MNRQASIPDSAQRPAAVAPSGAVLVIGNSADERDFLARLLDRALASPELALAVDGDEAVAVLRARPVACVLLDYGLPGEARLAVLERLLAVDPFLPVVVVSGQGNEAVAVAALQAGAADYIVKGDITARGLARSIGTAVEHAQLRRSLDEKSRDMEHFIRTLIHDARAPLRHITRFAEFLAEDVAERNFDSVDEYARAIVRSARRMDDLLAALRSYVTASGEVLFDTVETGEAICAATENLAEEIAASGAEITLGPLAPVHGHEPQLVQIFQNLILNAIKYAGDRPPRVSVTARTTAGGRVRIEVADNGTGIAEEQLERIFEPFVRLVSKDRVEGTGLGLSICRRIAEKMGGSIECSSRPGAGSRFTVELPPPAGRDPGA